jgi:MFS family permease
MAGTPGAADPAGPGLRRNRNWRLFWLSQSASITGDIVFDTSMLLWVARVIALNQPWAPAAAGGVLVAAAFPALVLGPFAGVLVDRWNRRRTMLAADAARAVLVAALVPLAFPSVAAHLPRLAELGIVYLLAAATASFSQFFNPSRFAMLGAIVTEPDVPRASGHLMSSTYAASVIGPPLAAPLLFTAGVQWALVINALSFGASFLGIWLIQVPSAPAAEGADIEKTPAAPAGYWREMEAGLRFFGTSTVLVAVTLGLFVTVLGAGALNALNVFFVQADLHASATLYGTIGMAEGIGGLAGTMAAGWVIARAGAGRTFWVGLVLSGLAVVCYSLMSSLVAALAVIAVLGAALGCVNTAISPLLLAATPQHMIGRVTSVLTPAASVAAIASTAAAGALASTVLRGFRATLAGVTLGPYETVIAAGGLLFVAAGLAAMMPLRRAAASGLADGQGRDKPTVAKSRRHHGSSRRPTASLTENDASLHQGMLMAFPQPGNSSSRPAPPYRDTLTTTAASNPHGAAFPTPERISDDGHMEWTFTGEVIEWRGPAPYLFVAMTPEESEDLKEAARGLIYWGQVPVFVTIGGTEFTTALFPRDGRYLVPVKAAVQRAEAIGEGAIVEVVLRLNAAR